MFERSNENSAKGRIAVVTGASSGNGRGIAIELAIRGFNVVCADVRELPLESGFEESLGTSTTEEIVKIGTESFFQRCDVSRPDQVEELIAETVKKFGRIDVMVNNAGVFTGFHTIVDETEEQYDFTMGVNAKGVWAGCKYAIAQMVKH
jgi:NAD(P)-dependent dehydrogenase (short-subunit alcohol dehydrogenase family)